MRFTSNSARILSSRLVSVIEPPVSTCADQLSRWVCGVRFADLPQDVVEQTSLRILDVFGLVLLLRAQRAPAVTA